MSVTHFERVSFEQFKKDMENLGLTYIFPNGGDQIRQAYDNIRLPRRATPDSAGYDFSLPFPVILRPGEHITIPTGICVEMDPGQFLLCLPRSGLGFRYGLQLFNQAGVIDAGYIHGDNGGHIMAKITIIGNRDMNLEAGDRFMQGIILPFATTVDDEPLQAVRTGGFGSTGA